MAFTESSKDVSQWLTAVRQNRQAETLDFRPANNVKITKGDLVNKFKPETDFEKEMNATLDQLGEERTDDSLIKEFEKEFNSDDDDDLGRKELTPEELREQRGKLAKMRALLFYEEQKRHHMNKIKSKKYRRIRKKQKLCQLQKDAKNGDEEEMKELEEKAERDRVLERMNLRHKKFVRIGQESVEKRWGDRQ